jgi:hypothetical protein
MKKIQRKAIIPDELGLSLIIVSLFGLVSCAGGPMTPSQKGNQNDPWVVTITWQSKDSCKVAAVTPESTVCVNNPQTDFCVGQSKWVEWQSDPAKKYMIFFSPFNSASLNAGNNGKAKGKINDKAPFALYKYSILADGCNETLDTYDPHIRVDN